MLSTCMAHDAHVGWLATITEPGGEYVDFHGEENTTRYIHEFRQRLNTVDQALRKAHLGSHEEPDFSVLGPDPKCLNSVRLGFYSSSRDWHLDSLIAHIEVHREIPMTMDALRPDTYATLSERYATHVPEKAPNAPKQSCLAHPYLVGVGFSSVYVPQAFSVVLELEKVQNEVGLIGSSVELERACSILLAACGYFDVWDERVMDIKEGLIADVEGLEPVEETPEWLVNTISLVDRLWRIAKRSLITRSMITFS